MDAVDARDSAGDARRDLLVIAAGVALFAAASVAFEFSEAMLRWTRPWERYQLDELPGILLVLAVALAWFAWRRMREARAELGRRVAAERNLAGALAENRRLSLSHLRVQEEERRQLARELHDELGQHLNAIKLDAVSIRALTQDTHPEVNQAARAIVGSSDHVHGVIRDILRRLRPPGLDELGLAAALEHLVHGWQARQPETRAELRVGAGVDALDEAGSIGIYRLVQEGLNNVARHARARTVTIVIERTPGSSSVPAEIVLSLADDGVGAPAGESHRGLGLIGMRERVEALGGSLVIDSAAGRGFRIRASIPQAEDGR